MVLVLVRSAQHWRGHKLILEARLGEWWDANKIGPACPSIVTSGGWLVIYRGVRLNAVGAIYRLGLALFDLAKPERCLKRSDEWVFGPEELYGQRGDVDNVVFPHNSTLCVDSDTLNLYYVAADTCVAMTTGSVRAMLQ